LTMQFFLANMRSGYETWSTVLGAFRAKVPVTAWADPVDKSIPDSYALENVQDVRRASVCRWYPSCSPVRRNLPNVGKPETFKEWVRSFRTFSMDHSLRRNN
jgi:hypothetical protein